MYTIIMDEDKQLVQTEVTALYKGENLVDKIRFLLPLTYSETPLSEFSVVAQYTNEHLEIIDEPMPFTGEKYRDYKYVYHLPVDTDLTKESGVVYLTLAFKKDDNVVLRSSGVFLSITNPDDEVPSVPIDPDIVKEQVVRVDVVQNLTEEEKERARNNIGAGNGGAGNRAVTSVNGKTGAVELTAADVGSQPKTLIVTITGGKADYTPAEIYKHIQNGGEAISYGYTGKTHRCTFANEAYATFEAIYFGGTTVISDVLSISEDGSCSSVSAFNNSGAVNSVNGKTGEVKLTAKDVGAKPNDFIITISDNEADKPFSAILEAYNEGRTLICIKGTALHNLTLIQSEIAQFDAPYNGGQYISRVLIFSNNSVNCVSVKVVEDEVKDNFLPVSGTGIKKALDALPQVPSSLPNPFPLTFTGAAEGSYDGSKALEVNIPEIAVQSVNGKTGAVNLSASDIGALPDTYTPPVQTAEQVGADPVGTATKAVGEHNVSTASHSDIRLQLTEIANRLNAFLDTDDTTLDELSEIVVYIKSNKELIDAVTTSKVNVTDIVNNLTTNVTNKPLSAAQGVALKALIDAITVPTKLSELTGDTTHRVVTDTEKNAWNAKSDFSGKYADLEGKPTIPSKTSQLTNDSNFLTSIPSEYITEEELETKKLATETYVINKIAEAELASSDVNLSGYATKDDIKNFITEVPSEYITETELSAKGYLTQHQDLSDYAKTGDVPTKLSELTEDSTHRVVTDAEKTAWSAKSNFSGSYNDLTDKPTIPTVPTKLSEFDNDKGYLTSYTETDPTVSAWAKEPNKPSYTKAEIGLGNVDNVKQYSASNPPPYPVTSVNGKTGAVSLSAGDVGALPSTYTPPNQTAAQVGADPKGTADSKVSTHNTSDTSHNDIRLLIEGLTTRLNALANSTDEDLDQLSEIVAYIKSNKTLIDSITTSKVNVADVINNLTTNVSNKPLSAAQGVVLKALIDAIKVPTKLSELSEDSTHRVVTDTEKAAWNAKSDFSGKYADLTEKPTVPTKTSQLTNDSNFLTSVPSEYVTDSELNAKGYLTQHQSLSGYAKTADHYTKTESDDKYQPKGNYLTSVPSEYVTETELTNKKYLTSIPSEYVTETELNSKGYVKDSSLVHINEKLDSTNIAYATCSTEAATAEKVVTVSGNDHWELKVGSVVMVYFEVSNSASNVTLNVNSTGAYPIWYNNAVYTSTGTAYTGYANRVITYMFNGTQWVWIAQSYDSNTTYTNVKLGHGYATCSTAEATTAKAGSLSSYTLTVGGIVAVKFTNAVPANATLNINSKGAKNIFYRGAKIVAGVIKAGDIATLIYDGTQYQLLSVDRWQNDIVGLQTGIENTNNVLNSISLGIASDGLIYTFVNGSPVGTGIPQGQSGDLFGYIDENNTVVLKGNLAEGTYSIKYEMDGGEIVNIGNLMLDSTVYYSVTSNLTNCTSNNSTKQIAQGESYSATITANSGYELKSVTATMGGTAVSVSDGIINIANVTGNIVITAVAEEAQTSGYTNLAKPNDTYWKEGYRLSISGGSTSELAGHTTTNFIPAKLGDVLRVKGMKIAGPPASSDYYKIVAYTTKDTESSKLGGLYGATTTNDDSYGLKVSTSGDVSTYTILYDNLGNQTTMTKLAYIRIDGELMSGYTKDDVIITINEEITEPINQIPLSIDADGNPYNGGQGWKTGYRIKSSTGAEEAASGIECTGFIPVQYGQTITLENIKATSSGTQSIGFYNADKTFLHGSYLSDWMLNVGGSGVLDGSKISRTLSGKIGGTTINASTGIAFMRFSANEITNNSVVTIM